MRGLLQEQKVPNVPYFVVGNEGFALNTNILRNLGGSKLSVKKKVCTNIACTEHECTWFVLLEF